MVDCNECMYCTLTENEQYYISQHYKKVLPHACALTEKELKHCECGSKKLVPVKEMCDGEKFEQREKKQISKKHLIGIMEIYKEGGIEIE